MTSALLHLRSATTAVAVLILIATGTLACDTTSDLMPPRALQAVVPELPEWARSTVTAQGIDLPAPATVAGATYTRGAARLDFEISDTGTGSEMVASLAATAGTPFERTLEQGYTRSTVVAGAPAIESWNATERYGELSVLVNRRYIINIGGRGIDDTSAMRALAERVNVTMLR